MSFEDCSYLTTNESLEAIIIGLEVNPEDKVLTICGSGDQPLAFIEKTKNLTIVDHMERQIKLFLYRKKILKSGKYSEFREIKSSEEDHISDLQLRNKYFSLKRLKRIEEKLRKLSQNLSEHGLVYLADANFVINKAESQGYNLNLFLFPLTINQT